MERVEKIELNIPSIFAHGVFRKGGKDVLLSKTGIEYYYSLVWLARNKMLDAFEQTKDEDGKRTYNIDGSKWNKKLDIELYDIVKVSNPKHKSDYKQIRNFLSVLDGLSIETNALEKVDEAPRHIKVVDSLKYKDEDGQYLETLSIKFNQEFIQEFMHTKKLFKKVYLNYLFLLKGFKDKMLYLMLKDYVNYSKKIDSKVLYRLLGEKNDKKITALVKSINYNTDITIVEPKEQPKALGKNRFTYTFTVKSNLVFLDMYDKIVYCIKQELWSEAKKQTPQLDKDNKPIKDLEAYTKSVYKELMHDFESINKIEIKLAKARKKLEQHRDDDYKQYILMIDTDGMKYLVQDNYSLFGYSNITQKTTTIKDTVAIIENINSFELVNLNSISQTHGTKSLL